MTKSKEVIDAIVSKMEAWGLTANKAKAIIEHRCINIITNNTSKDSDSIGAGALLAKIEKLTNDTQQNTQVNIYQDTLRDIELKEGKGSDDEG